MTSIVPQSDIPQPGDPRSDLYDRDFVLWCDEMVAHLKSRNWDKLDTENLIEEIEGLAGRDRRELVSRLHILLANLLKRIYTENLEEYRGWEATIREQRREIQLLLEQSPSLQAHLLQKFTVCWGYALEDVKDDYSNITFPNEWQYSREVGDLLSVSFWLESSEGLDDSDDRSNTSRYPS